MKNVLILVIAIFLAGMLGCAGLENRASQPDRTYVGIEYDTLYQYYETVLKAHGFEIDKKNYSRGYISSSLKEYEGDIKGFATWDEQRKYVAWFDVDRGNCLKHFLILEAVVSERAPLSFEWRKKKIERAKDEEFLEILSDLDRIVQSNGGMVQ